MKCQVIPLLAVLLLLSISSSSGRLLSTRVQSKLAMTEGGLMSTRVTSPLDVPRVPDGAEMELYVLHAPLMKKKVGSVLGQAKLFHGGFGYCEKGKNSSCGGFEYNAKNGVVAALMPIAANEVLLSSPLLCYLLFIAHHVLIAPLHLVVVIAVAVGEGRQVRVGE